MRNEILDKIKKVIQKKEILESDVVYFLIQLYKLNERCKAEKNNSEKSIPYIKFFRNWVSHGLINHNNTVNKIIFNYILYKQISLDVFLDLLIKEIRETEFLNLTDSFIEKFKINLIKVISDVSVFCEKYNVEFKVNKNILEVYYYVDILGVGKIKFLVKTNNIQSEYVIFAGNEYVYVFDLYIYFLDSDKEQLFRNIRIITDSNKIYPEKFIFDNIGGIFQRKDYDKISFPDLIIIKEKNVELNIMCSNFEEDYKENKYFCHVKNKELIKGENKKFFECMQCEYFEMIKYHLFKPFGDGNRKNPGAYFEYIFNGDALEWYYGRNFNY